MSVFIIAEAGVNHGGSLDSAMELVNAAKEAGADAVKFQAFTPERLDPPGERRDMLERLKLSDGDFRVLAAQCRTVGIEFMATPFDPDWLDFLVGLGMKRIKIASGQLDNGPLVTRARGLKLPTYFSTGMIDEDRIVRLLGHQFEHEKLLLCTSAYPCPIEDVNLAAMRGMDGLSLHAPEPALGVAAAAMGASVIEAHFMLEPIKDGPDSASSMMPRQFARMVREVRLVERAMGDGVKRPMPSEAKAIEIARERREWRERQTAA